jgi:hypothetical protein
MEIVKQALGRTYNTLLHRKALLVVASSNADDLFKLISRELPSIIYHIAYVAFPLITQAVGWHFIPHSLVHEDAKLAVIFDFEQLL